MRAKEFSQLNELRDNPAPTYIDKKESTDDKLVILSPELDLKIFFSRNRFGNALVAGEKSFKRHVEILFSVAQEYDITGKGAGKKFRIFSTVGSALQNYLHWFLKPTDDAVFFTSDNLEESRLSLYPKVAIKYVNDILGSGWNFFTYKKKYDTYYIWERIGIDNKEPIDEAPLPPDWDPSAMRQQGTTFKSRLTYALDRAAKLGTGSSRVATIIEYEGRPTVLKIAKNQKGLAQNSVEADILSDGYASQLGILIPIIDYDEQNREPSWIHTEKAEKASEKQLCSIMKCPNLYILVNMAWAITGRKKYIGNYQGFVDHLKQNTRMTDQDIDTLTEYATALAELNSSFDVELGDFTRAANWGIYQGKPVIVDVGFNSNVMNQYYKK